MSGEWPNTDLGLQFRDDAMVIIHQLTFAEHSSMYQYGRGIPEPLKLECPGDDDMSFKKHISGIIDGKVMFNVNLVPIDVIKEINEISISEETIKYLDNIALILLC